MTPGTLQCTALAAILAGMTACANPVLKPAADLVVVNARVWTVDNEKPQAEGVAVIGERFVAVGSSAEIESWRGPRTRVIDAGGRLVLPGFNDAHVHFIDGGRQLDNVDLKDAPTPQEFARRIGERAGKTPPGEWIVGGDWDEQQWNPPALPSRDLIDPVTPSTPVFVNRYDGHMSLAWIPDQKITVQEAVAAYTMGSAYAEFQESEKGSITPGKLADMVILDRDIFQIPPADIRNAKVLFTIEGGKMVFSAKP